MPTSPDLQPGGAHALLLVGHRSYRARAFAGAVRAAGLSLLTVTDRDSAIAGLARGTVLCARPDDPGAADAIVGHLERLRDARGVRCAAVLAPDDDYAALGARVARALGLPGHDPDAVRVAGDKLATRQACARAGCPGPHFAAIDARHAGAPGWAEGQPFPCVVKPTRLGAGAGIIRADDAHALGHAARRAALIARAHGQADAALMVEGFLPGREVVVEALVVRGRMHALALLDKPDAGAGPYFDETLLITPSRLAPDEQRQAVAEAARCVAAVGLEHGPVHAELRVQEGRATLIELAARPIGGMCSPVVGLAGFSSLEAAIVHNALGRDLAPADLGQAPGSRGVLMVPAPRAGELVAVHGVDRARAVAGVAEVVVAAAPGARVAPAPDPGPYLGFVFATAETSHEVEAALRQAHAHLHVAIRARPDE